MPARRQIPLAPVSESNNGTAADSSDDSSSDDDPTESTFDHTAHGPASTPGATATRAQSRPQLIGRLGRGIAGDQLQPAAPAPGPTAEQVQALADSIAGLVKNVGAALRDLACTRSSLRRIPR